MISGVQTLALIPRKDNWVITDVYCSTVYLRLQTLLALKSILIVPS